LNHGVLPLLLVLSLFAAVPAAVWAQGQGMPQEDPNKKPTQQPTVTNKVRIQIEQHVDESNVIQEKRLVPPLEYQQDGLDFRLDAKFFYNRPEDKDPAPQNLGASIRVSLLTLTVPAGSNSRFDPGAKSLPLISGQPPPIGDETGHPTPIISKSAAVFASGTSASSESDVGSFVGPELTYALKEDLSEWRAMRWLPEASSWEIYARAQTGSLDLFNSSVSAKLYGVGFRLNLPFYRTDSFHADASISAGPGYLNTELGDVLAFDGSVGLRVIQVLGTGVNFVGSAEFQILKSQDTAASGPSFSVGLDLSW
jgi:hypothetical protein